MRRCSEHNNNEYWLLSSNATPVVGGGCSAAVATFVVSGLSSNGNICGDWWLFSRIGETCCPDWCVATAQHQLTMMVMVVAYSAIILYNNGDMCWRMFFVSSNA